MAREELSEPETAASGYSCCLEIEPNGKAARQVRQRLAALERAAARSAAAASADTNGP